MLYSCDFQVHWNCIMQKTQTLCCYSYPLPHSHAISDSGELRMAQVFLSDRICCQVVAFKAPYCSCATVLITRATVLITNVIIVNSFVDNINSKYIVAMATSHPATV